MVVQTLYLVVITNASYGLCLSLCTYVFKKYILNPRILQQYYSLLTLVHIIIIPVVLEHSIYVHTFSDPELVCQSSQFFFFLCPPWHMAWNHITFSSRLLFSRPSSRAGGVKPAFFFLLLCPLRERGCKRLLIVLWLFWYGCCSPPLPKCRRQAGLHINLMMLPWNWKSLDDHFFAAQLR